MLRWALLTTLCTLIVVQAIPAPQLSIIIGDPTRLTDYPSYPPQTPTSTSSSVPTTSSVPPTTKPSTSTSKTSTSSTSSKPSTTSTSTSKSVTSTSTTSKSVSTSSTTTSKSSSTSSTKIVTDPWGYPNPTTTTTKGSPTTITTVIVTTVGVDPPYASHFAQCGGIGWTGPTQCQTPYVCKYSNDWYSQCL